MIARWLCLAHDGNYCHDDSPHCGMGRSYRIYLDGDADLCFPPFSFADMHWHGMEGTTISLLDGEAFTERA